MKAIRRSDQQVSDLLDEVRLSVDRNKSAFQHKTYEEGVLTAIEWILGDCDDHPMAP